MTEPTQEQIKEFWERCGFKFDKEFPITPQGSVWWTPPVDIDLNNLFKYAVPKVKDIHQLLYIYFDAPYDEQEDWYCKVSSDATGAYKQLGSGRDKDPALALFWALWEVMKK